MIVIFVMMMMMMMIIIIIRETRYVCKPFHRKLRGKIILSVSIYRMMIMILLIGKQEVHIKVWLDNHMERDHL
jgi:hypothetical protein